jgi:hypothetical protein
MRTGKYLFGAIFFAAVNAACVDPTAPRAFLDGPAEGLEFSASISKSVIPRGDTATLRYVLRNPQAQSVTLQFGSGCQLLLFVRRGRSVVYPYGPMICTAALTTLTLRPNEEVVRTSVFRAARFIQHNLTDIPLHAGEYVAYAEIANGSGRSNTVNFTVRD